MPAVGFIGIGKMGAPMARHLAKKGFDLYIDDLRSQVVADFISVHGGQRMDRIQMPILDVIITMLPDGRAVRDVVLGRSGEEGVVSRLRPGGLVVDMSSSDPMGTRALGKTLAARGISMMDAPVSGGVVFAENGTLSILVGGAPDHVELCRPLFTAVGTEVFHCGSLGCGHALKALCNFVNAASLVSLLEALAAASRFGIETDTTMAALRAATTGRNHPLEKKITPHVLTRRFATGMALGLIAKDVGIATDLAAALEISAPMMKSCSRAWNEAIERLGFEADQTEIARIWDRR